MYRFVSERYFDAHKEYLRTLKLRYSVYEKDMRKPMGCTYEALSGVDLPKQQRIRVQPLLVEILLHEVYFNSFSNKEHMPSLSIREYFLSESNFMNQIYGMAMSVSTGFVGVWQKGGKPQLFSLVDYREGLQGKPILALDVCEHAYFGDYAFNKERYVRDALKYINTQVFDAFCKTS